MSIMPGTQMQADTVMATTGLDNLKAHRILPHKDALIGRERFEATKQKFEQKYVSESTDDLNRRRANALNNQTTSDPALPPTPPLNFHDDPEDESLEDKIARDHVLAARSFSSGVSTPLVQRSPPTPETTPPRAATHGNNTSSLSRDPSLDTRAESFRTAREDLPSEDEAQDMDSPSLRPSRQRWLKGLSDSNIKEIGLGLGLESGDEEPISGDTTPVAPRTRRLPSQAGSRRMTSEDPYSSNSEYLDYDSDGSKRRGKVLGQLVRTQHTISNETARLVKDLDVEYARDNSYEKRRKLRRSPDDAALKQFTQEVRWPIAEEDPLLYSSPRSKEAINEDAKRESQISTHSSVVEVMVVASSTPTRRHTLRRTSKVQNFDVQTPTSDRSNRSSDVSGISRSKRQRLRHVSSPETIKRHSISSHELFSAASTNDRKSQHMPTSRESPLRWPPHSVDPALAPRDPESLRAEKSVESSARPTTAPENSAGYFDIPRRDQPVTSTLIKSGTVARDGRQKPRKSAQSKLFAEVSPAATPGKVTMEVSEAAQKPRAVVNDRVPERPGSSSREHQMQVDERPSAPEWNALQPSSALVTPFSLRSVQSSTPGTLEVNEATAISIYPHTNRSILVVQQMSQTSQPAEQQTAVVASNANFAISSGAEGSGRGRGNDMKIISTINGVGMHNNGKRLSVPNDHNFRPHRNSAIVDQVMTRRSVDSPLRNPRVAPTPPDLRLIAPTPRNDLSSPNFRQPSENAPPQPSKRSRLTQPFTAIRRSMSARRFSESIMAPLTQNFSLSNRRNIPAGSPKRRRESLGSLDTRKNNLHPSWRPRGFWTDITDDESEPDFGNSGQLSTSTAQTRDWQRHRRQGSIPFLGKKPYERFETSKRSQSLSSRITGSLRLPKRDRSTSAVRGPYYPTTTTTTTTDQQRDNPFTRMRRRMSAREPADDVRAREPSPSRRRSFMASSTGKLGDLLDRQKSLRRKKSFDGLNNNDESYEFITTDPSSKRTSKAMDPWLVGNDNGEDDNSRPSTNGQIIDSYAKRNLQSGLYDDEVHDDEDEECEEYEFDGQERIPRQGYPVEFIAARPLVDSHSLSKALPQQETASPITARSTRPNPSVLTTASSAIRTAIPAPAPSLSAASGRQTTRRYSIERRNSSNTNIIHSNSSRPGITGSTVSSTTVWGGGSGSSTRAVSREAPGLRRKGVRKDETVREMVKRMTGVVIPPNS